LGDDLADTSEKTDISASFWGGRNHRNDSASMKILQREQELHDRKTDHRTQTVLVWVVFGYCKGKR
jgi:hypothetical protein